MLKVINTNLNYQNKFQIYQIFFSVY